MGDLAKRVGINYQTVFLNECGVFPGIIPKLRTYLIKSFVQDGDDLDERYRRFVLDKRRVFAIQFFDKLETLPEADLSHHPFSDFRVHISEEFQSRTHFAKTICVEPAGLYRLETLPLPDIPSRLREALLQVGVSSSNIEELNERINEFHARSK